MELNENQIDRIIRVVLGIVLIIGAAYLILTNSSTIMVFVGAILGVIGIIALATGVTGFCLLYKICGVSTCPLK